MQVNTHLCLLAHAGDRRVGLDGYGLYRGGGADSRVRVYNLPIISVDLCLSICNTITQ